ncbi:hypothetical protein SpCBS45565_g02813 [Spizellomyces sp. 'palustris']|nr:hypothetical protein SpCBS45565_g02813 [Spizellomyces sp. 'palustris']
MTLPYFEFYPVPGFESGKLAGTTLLMPGPNGLGNIGQLALDLLISSLDLIRVGFISSTLVLPVCGNEDYGNETAPNTLHTSFEVYQSRPSNTTSITLIQIRSPVIPKKGVLFSKSFAHWAQQMAFESVVLVTAADAGRRVDGQIRSDRLRFISTCDKHAHADRLQQLGFPKLEANETKHAWVASDLASPIPPGAGVSRFIFDELRDISVPLLTLIWFAIEGDNYQDALQLASAVRSLVNQGEDDSERNTWKTPLSWKGLYGNAMFTKALFQ